MLIDSREKRICQLSFEFRVCMLLKGAVNFVAPCFEQLTTYRGSQQLHNIF